MRRLQAALFVTLFASGCATYAVYSKAYGDGPSTETMQILLAAESAAGVLTAVGVAVVERRKDPWYTNAAIGFVVPFILDVAIALGVETSDFVGE